MFYPYNVTNKKLSKRHNKTHGIKPNYVVEDDLFNTYPFGDKQIQSSGKSSFHYYGTNICGDKYVGFGTA